MEISDKKLFLKYALPCSVVLIRRGQVEKGVIDKLFMKVEEGKRIKGNPGEIFQFAGAACKLIARERGKDKIDSEVIREYFLERHDKAVTERHKEMRDFKPSECRVYPGKVLETGDLIRALTPRGIKLFRKDFEPFIKEGDYVTVHRGFVIEKIHKALAKNLWEKKKRYIKSFVPFR